MKRRIVIIIIALGILVAIGVPLSGVLTASGPVNITTERYNNSRNAVNTNETVLNTLNVNSTKFGKLFSDAVDGDIYTQPLIVTGVAIPGKGTHNVVYVATMHNTVYAFDADKVGPPLWSRNLGPSWHGECTQCSSFPNPDLETFDIPGGEDGVLGTPVIDTTTGTMYLVSHVGGSPATHKLHALDITTGNEKLGGPITIAGSVSNAFGANNVGGVITYDAGQQLQRPALALVQGRVLIAMGSSGDFFPFYGWLFAYDTTNFSASYVNAHPPAVWLTSPQGWGSGIWMAGSGPVIDASNNIYVVTGNGDYSATRSGANISDYGDSVAKLTLDTALNKFNVVDYFTPWNQAELDNGDNDLGSSNFVLIPGTHLLFGGGKTSTVYLIDTMNMGQYVCDLPSNNCNDSNNQDNVDNNDTNIVQEWNGKVSHLHNTPNVWKDPSGRTLVYVFAEQDYLKAFQFVPNGTSGTFIQVPPPNLTSNFQNNGMPSGDLSISSNGAVANTGIVWAIDTKSNFRAYNAVNLTDAGILWTDAQNAARDDVGVATKFNPPVVANGKVYVGTRSGRLSVYGELPPPPTGGQLVGAVTDPPATNVNLTAEGTLDWAHWGTINNLSFDHKMGTSAPVNLITPLVTKGAGPFQYTDNLTGFTWSDGTAPTASQSSPTHTGVFTLFVSPGDQDVPNFQFTVPADTIARTLKVYVGAFSAGAQFRASLSDGSVADFVATNNQNLNGNDYRVYTLTYKAASANQTLFVTWSMLQDNAGGHGNITIQAVSLAGPAFGLPTSTPSPTITNTPTETPTGSPQPTFLPPTKTPAASLTPTNTRTATAGPSPTPTASQTPAPPDAFRVLYQAINVANTTNQIRMAFNIVNYTNNVANLSDFKLRYYFTKNGGGNLTFGCELATLVTCNNVSNTLGTISPAVSGADSYLELSFATSGVTLPPNGGSSTAIQVHIGKDDGSTFDQTDDFSFDPSMMNFSESRRVALFRNGVLLWGSVPTLGAATLISPTTGSTGQPSHPTLTWTTNTSASRYQVRINNSKNSTVFQQWYSALPPVCSAGTCSVTPNVTLPNDTYTWWVETGTPTQNGPWSVGWKFKVGP